MVGLTMDSGFVFGQFLQRWAANSYVAGRTTQAILDSLEMPASFPQSIRPAHRCHARTADRWQRRDAPPHGRPADRTFYPRARPEENEIHAVLRDNLARANAAGLNEVSPRPRRSRRRRDYFLTLLIGNTVLVGGAFLMPVFAIAGMIIFNLGATWIMWFVMDDY
jgi:hypothetical protein